MRCSAAMNDSAEKTSPTKEFVIRTVGDLFVLIGPQAPSAEAVTWLEREAFAFADARPKRAVYLHFIYESPGFSMPDDAARTAMQRFVNRAGAKFAAAAVVVDQKGFLGAALRSVFSGVLLAVRTPTPTKICADAAEARTFLLSQVKGSVPLDDDALAAEIARLRPSLAA